MQYLCHLVDKNLINNWAKDSQMVFVYFSLAYYLVV